MIEGFFRLLEKWGTLAGWITAIVQLPLWLIVIPFFYYKNKKKRKEIDSLIQEQTYWRDECYKMKDLASSWHQVTKEAVSIMKYNAPATYKKYVEDYGGEDKFQEWWKLPDIPVVEDKDGSEK